MTDTESLPADVAAMPVRYSDTVTLRIAPLWNECSVSVDGKAWHAKGLDVHVRVGYLTTIVVHDRELVDATDAPIITTGDNGELVFASETVRLEPNRIVFV